MLKVITQLKVSVGQHSHAGIKAQNQDFTGIRIPQNSQLALKGVALASADGISSSEFSHIASETAVSNFLDDYYCTSETWTVQKSAEHVLAAINSWLYSQTMRGPGRYDKDKGYVCTFAAVFVKGRFAHLFHAGDTRIYRCSPNGLEQLTNDHRLWASEDKSYLSRALGVEARCEFEYQKISAKEGEQFIVVTDGVYEFVSAPMISEIVGAHETDLDKSARKLIERALANGSDDNLSAQILRIEALPAQSQMEVKQQVDQLPLPPKLSPRMEFDGYTIVRELHSSNRSHVFVAIENITHKKVVIKTLATETSADESHLERFLMEEWIAKRINNPHVLKAEIPDRERKLLYTVFEFIEGQTLAQWALDNPKPKLEAVRYIVEQIAKGLQAFHRLEMLHQDLRPENIMIDAQGTVKIIDFGAVTIAGIEESKVYPSDTYLVGTALYSAPEYFICERGTVQSELYSLGVITYFLLSGKYPYGTNVPKAKTLLAQKKLQYQSVLEEDRELPAWVDYAIQKATHPLPYKRYEEIFEFIHDLRQPNVQFTHRTRPPLLERNPIAFWQGVSALLAAIVVYLLTKN